MPADDIFPLVKGQRAAVPIQPEPAADARLRPGMSGEVSLTFGRRANVLTVPVTAVLRRDNERYCWVRDGDGNIVLRTVVIGVQGEHGVEIREGLAAGDQVLADPRAVARNLDSR